MQRIGKIDAVKSKINAITALMVVFLTALFAVIGYVFVHWNKFDTIDVYVVFGAMFGLAISFFICIIWLGKEIKILEEM